MSRAPTQYATLLRSCAEEATSAISQLLLGEPSGEVLRCWTVTDGRVPSEAFGPTERLTAVFARLEGDMAGPAGLLIPLPALEFIIATQVGDPDVKTFDERSFSALCELGNIAVSAAANALSQETGAPVLPSVPRLGLEKPAQTCLEDVWGDVAGRPILLAETALRCRGDEVKLLFVWMPQA